MRSADRARVVSRLASLALPLVGFANMLCIQIVIPRLLQVRMSVAEYAAYVLATTAAGYVSMADSGMLLPLLRELTSLHGRGELELYVGELVRSVRIYVWAALVGLFLGAVAFFSARSALGETWAPALSAGYLWAVVSVLATTALRLWAASQHSAFLLSQGRYVLAQCLGISNVLVPSFGLGTALVLTRDLIFSLHIMAALTMAHACAQVAHGSISFRRQFRGVPGRAPKRAFMAVLTEGLALRVGDSMALYGFPHLLTVLQVALIPAAMPARTLTNGCRQITQQMVTLLEIRTTRRVSSLPRDPFSEYDIAAAAISAFHLICLGAVDLFSVLIFSAWLPHLAPTVRPFLQGLFIEQTLLSAVLPSSALYVSLGQFRSLGAIKLLGAFIGGLTLAGLIRVLPQQAFGLAYACSTLPYFFLGVYSELGGREGCPPSTSRSRVRYARASAVAVLYTGLLSLPSYVAPTVAVASSLPSLLRALLAIYARVRGDHQAALGTTVA